MIWIFLTGAAGFLLWYSLVRPLNHFTKMGVKQLRPWPIMGNHWSVMLGTKSFAEVILDIYNKYPKSRYVGFFNFAAPVLMLRDPDLIKQITVKDFDSFTDHRNFVDPDADPLWGANLFLLKGQRWKDMRATLSGSFTSSKMKHMFGMINETAENFVQFFLDKKQDLIETEMKDVYTRFTNDVIATSAFGIKVDSLAEPNNSFYTNGKRVSSFSGFFTVLKFMAYFWVPKLFKLLKLSIFRQDVLRFFKNVIFETITLREEKGIVRQDMINLLLETRKGIKTEEADVIETGFATVQESTILENSKFNQLKLTNDEIASQALIFFVAGFDTVSTGLCFGTYELATNKEVQERLRKEILKTHEANNGKLTYDSLLKMKYMDMVFSEILRKWPPVVAIDRVCTKPYTIEPIYPDENPVHLKVGDAMMLPMHGLHRDPKHYSEPEKFVPERFSDENKDSIRPYTYIPFGSGPRNCIGSRFAILEAKAVLYHLLRNFEIVPIKRTRIPLKILSRSLQHGAEGGFWLGLKRIQV